MNPDEELTGSASGRGLVVRSMRAADYARVAELWDASACPIHAGADDLAAIAMFLGQNPDLSVVAEMGKRIVGALLCGEDGRAGFIHRLTLDLSEISEEVADSMVRRCLLRLRALGLTRCYLICEDSCLSVEIGRGASLGLGKAVATIAERALAGAQRTGKARGSGGPASTEITAARNRR